MFGDSNDEAGALPWSTVGHDAFDESGDFIRVALSTGGWSSIWRKESHIEIDARPTRS